MNSKQHVVFEAPPNPPRPSPIGQVSKLARFGGHASLPGTGPRGRSCASCHYCAPAGHEFSRTYVICHLAFEQLVQGEFSRIYRVATDQARGLMRRLGRIKRSPPSCKITWCVSSEADPAPSRLRISAPTRRFSLRRISYDKP